MLILALLLACGEPGDTDYECLPTEHMDAMDTTFFQNDECPQIGRDATAGDPVALEILEMDPKDIGEMYNCKPARVAGEDCLRIANEHYFTGTE